MIGFDWFYGDKDGYFEMVLGSSSEVQDYSDKLKESGEIINYETNEEKE